MRPVCEGIPPDPPSSVPIEDYALLGDCQTAALVSRGGSIDWLCVPRFDSPACFAALLGGSQLGRWIVAPKDPNARVSRRYRPDTLILETDFETAEGAVRLIDCMPPRTAEPDVVRVAVGLRGRVEMAMQLVIRCEYGSVVPWVQHAGSGITAIAGPDLLRLTTPVNTRGRNLTTCAEFAVGEGDRVPFVLSWFPSHQGPGPEVDAMTALDATEEWWRAWASHYKCSSPRRAAILRSLITLKALTYAPTGGIVAAPTTSLPEFIGGVRNWDYRFCWVRDATIVLLALINSGFREEAQSWRDWLLRAVAGSPDDLQTLYGIAGERRLPELELPWLPGYEGSRPVRIGNAAAAQLQLDVYGELLDALYQCRRIGLPAHESWRVELALLRFLENAWTQPDEGIWEIRGPRRHFTHSKMMAWVAFDRAVKSVEHFGLEGPVEHWREVRDAIHDDVCKRGWDAGQNAFVQSYGSSALDASLLLMPQVGFLPPSDPRVQGTIESIRRRLTYGGLVARYNTRTGVDGLPAGEGVFLPCSFWMADALALLGRHGEAVELFERLLALRNDVGLFSEEYDPAAKRFLGNFPQAFTHVAMINTAHNLSTSPGPMEQRAAK